MHDTADFYGNMKLRSKLLTADGSNIYQYVANQSIMGLMPRSFKFKENQSDRTHYGFIAQDVEALIDELGFTSKDMAGFIKIPHTRKKDVIDKTEPYYGENEVIPEGEERHGFTYSLRYNELYLRFIDSARCYMKKTSSRGSGSMHWRIHCKMYDDI